jgi:hypothetical protein
VKREHFDGVRALHTAPHSRRRTVDGLRSRQRNPRTRCRLSARPPAGLVCPRS